MLRDIIDSGVIPVVRLTRIFRQAQSSRIVMSAHAINRGCFPDISNGQHTDFFFMKQEEPEKVAETIVSLVRDRLPKAYRQPNANIQVLTPMQRGVVGAANLNVALQQALNHNTAALVRGGYTFKEGDRVMQLRNNYDKDVYNGDLGYVRSVDMEERTLTVDFDGQMVEYEASELDELTLAYATTIHKSPRVRISHCGDAGADDPLCDAPAQPHIYRYHPCQKDLCIGGSDQSPCLRYSQHEGVEAQHPAEGTSCSRRH